MITPWTRTFQYIEDFYRTLYEIYAEHYVAAYPITYYSTDHENTVWDSQNLNAGTYEKGGVGPLSGQKWRRIQMLPVFGVETVQMLQESGEKGGMTFRDGASTQIVFPSLYGLLPVEQDVVDLSAGYKTMAIKNKMLFQVNNINPAHQNDFFTIFQCQLKMAPFTKDDLEKQISSEWLFYEFSKEILPLENARRLLKLQELSVATTEVTNNLFDKQTSFYLCDIV